MIANLYGVYIPCIIFITSDQKGIMSRGCKLFTQGLCLSEQKEQLCSFNHLHGGRNTLTDMHKANWLSYMEKQHLLNTQQTQTPSRLSFLHPVSIHLFWNQHQRSHPFSYTAQSVLGALWRKRAVTRGPLAGTILKSPSADLNSYQRSRHPLGTCWGHSSATRTGLPKSTRRKLKSCPCHWI